jgi:Membrane protein implicated in regulation of membrane protease activity
MGIMFWAIVTVTMAILEIIIPGLVTIWFACAGLVLVLISEMVKNSTVEFFIFAVTALLLVIFTRPALKRWIEVRKKAYEGEGSETVIENVTEDGKYEVRFKGILWTAISPYIFVKGEKVIIDGFEGNKIILRKKEDD